MVELEQLVLEVTSKGAKEVNTELDKMDEKTKKATSGFEGLKAGLLAIIGAAAGLGVVGKLLVDATKKYQDYNAQLKIATKSQEGATVAMDALTDFAAKTPYSLDQAVNAFTKLVNLGLDPSEKALMSYGNTASSMGKELTDFIEAVADAATGEFERLKEFGIKASKEGDKVTFTFQGQKTVVDNTAKSIEGYLQQLGNVQFAGAMAERMKGLSGAMSNLGDAWDQLWINIAKQGPDSFLTKAFQAAGDALGEFNTQLRSGQLQETLKSWAALWDGWAEVAKTDIESITHFLSGAVTLWGAYGDQTTASWKDVFAYLPAAALAAFQKIGITLVDWVNTAKLMAQNFYEHFKAAFEQINNLAFQTGEVLKGLLHGELKSLDIVANIKYGVALHTNADKATNDALKASSDATLAAQAAVDQQLAATMTKHDDAARHADELRKKFDAEQATPKGDRLAGFRVGGDDKPEDKDAEKKAKAAADKEAKFQEKLFEDRVDFLEKGLVREGQVISDAYEERKKTILENEHSTQEEKKALVLLALSESIVSEEQNIKDSYERRKEFILSSTALTEAQKTKLMTDLTRAREENIRKVETDNMNKRLDQASQFFGNIASIGSTFGKKGFKIAQAAAIAQATMDTYKAATGAYSSLAGIPYVGPALGAAAAAAAIVAGMARVAQIKSQTYQGAYEHGGMISAGRYGLVGEAGPEYVQGPAVVTSAATTAAAQRGNSGVRNVTVHNMGAPVQAEASQSGDNLIVTLRPILEQQRKQIHGEIVSDIKRGGGPVSGTIEQTYGIRRGAV